MYTDSLGPSRFTVDSSGVLVSSGSASQRTTDTHWWSDGSSTPTPDSNTNSNNDKGKGRFFSESIIDELRGRKGSLQDAQSLAGQGGRVLGDGMLSSTASVQLYRDQVPMSLRRGRYSSQDSIDGAEVFGKLSAHMDDRSRGTGRSRRDI